MRTTFLLIRHASHDLLGRALAGRAPGVRLNETGQAEAQKLVARLAATRITAIYTSPRERALETATPLAAARGLKAVTVAALDEIDFGDWTGRAFAELGQDPLWPVWVDRRSVAQPPNGERYADVQRRAVRALDDLRQTHPDATLALFTHGDVIKATIAHVLGLSLDRMECFDVAPCSISIITAGDGWSQVKLVNDLGAAESWSS